MKRRARQCVNCVRTGMPKYATRYTLEKIGKGKYKCTRCGVIVSIPEKKK